MRVESRTFKHKKYALLICETEQESNIVDAILGDCGTGEVRVNGVVALADGFREHYIRLETAPMKRKKRWPQPKQ